MQCEKGSILLRSDSLAWGKRLVKTLSNQQIIGKRGALLFGEAVLSHGLSFHETNALDTGIDGYIELRDPSTGEVKAQYIASQVKTREKGRFAEETDESFSFTCEPRDLEYWMGANTPVILVVVRLSDRLVFWKSVKTWFNEQDRIRSRKVVFNKNTDLLDDAALPAFGALVASFAQPGLMVPSMRGEESLESNILRVIYPDNVHVAMTSLSHREIRQALAETYDSPPRDWVLYGGRIWSFHDISHPPFRDLIDEGTDEWIGTKEWYSSDGDASRRQFVELLRKTLAEMLHETLVNWKSKGYLFFKKFKERRDRKHSYQSFLKRTSRDVVKGYGKAGEPPSYYRHAAFYPNFLELGGCWYLGIDPTYHFTSDGKIEYRNAGERLSGIKRLETNQSVRGQIGMWKAFLIRDLDLLRNDFLRFEDVPPVSLGFGVPDDLWRGNEDDDEKVRVEKAQHEFPL